MDDNSVKALREIQGRSRILLVGLTGGIASGKSTVAHMLEGIGSHVIDFDALARRVVQPGRPAWKKIVDYFGEGILEKNGEIDRKRLSELVFGDVEKLKRLEEFTYPFIGGEFIGDLERIAANNPDAIIQAVVPLLVEKGLQSLFNIIVVVYLSREKQIERLMERDGISTGHAINIINSQMDIDKKVERADFMIDNGGPIEENVLF